MSLFASRPGRRAAFPDAHRALASTRIHRDADVRGAPVPGRLMATAVAPSAGLSRPIDPRATRWLGAFALAASPMFAVMRALAPDTGRPAPRVAAALDLLFLAGWACSAIGLWRQRAVGGARRPAIVLAAQLVGLALAAGNELPDLLGTARVPGSAYEIVTDVMWPASVTSMLVVGALVCGLALPVFFVVLAVAGRRIGEPWFAAHTTIAWALLALAVARG